MEQTGIRHIHSTIAYYGIPKNRVTDTTDEPCCDMNLLLRHYQKETVASRKTTHGDHVHLYRKHSQFQQNHKERKINSQSAEQSVTHECIIIL